MSKEIIIKTIQSMKPEFSKALPPHVSPDKFMRILQTSILTTPKLMEANKADLFLAALKSAQAGLLPDGREAAMVPNYNGTVKFIPMIDGLLKHVRNSGQLKTITLQLIYSGDEFEYFIDESGEVLRHRPKLFGGDRGEIIGVYGIATTKDDAKYIEIMDMEQVKAVEKVSQAKTGPWKGDFRGEMIKKTLFRRLYKRLPKSTDIDQDLIHTAIENDEEFDFTKDVTPEKTQTKVESPKKTKASIKKEDPPQDFKPSASNPDAIEVEAKEVVEPVPQEEIPI